MSVSFQLRRGLLWLTRGLARKVGLLLTLLFVGFAICLAVAYDLAQERAMRQQLQAWAGVLAKMHARLAGTHLQGHRLDELHRTLDELRRNGSVVYAYVLDGEDRLLTDGGAGGDLASVADDPLTALARGRRQGVVRFDERTLHAAEPVPLNGQAPGMVRLGLDLGPMRQEVRALRGRTLAITFAFLGIGLLSSVMLLRRTTRALALLTDTTRAAASGRFTGRIEVATNDELQGLAVAFNQMLADLDRSTVSRDYVNKILNTMSDALVVVVPDGRIRTINAAARELLGCADDLVGQHCAVLFPVHSERVGQLTAALGQGEPFGPLEAHWRRQDGEPTPVMLSGAMMADRTAMVLVAQDIRVRKLAYFDVVTELPNRLYFKQLLDRALAAASRHRRMLAVLFIDLDHFKLVNDSYGHDVGDRLLKSFAERLMRCVRSDDVAARAGAEFSNPLARLGGDEFTLLLAEIGSAADVAQVVDRILQALAEPFTIDDHQLLVGTSVGIALYPEHGTDAATLIRNADTAMYQAKHQGRSHARFFSAQLEQSTAERLTLESELRRAVADRALTVHYQPQLQARTGRVVGVEALVRWRHPRLGDVPPATFIPIAEESGLIVPLGAWVLQTACAQGQAWQEAGPGPLRVAVNVSAIQLQRDAFVDQVASALRVSGLPPPLLELEISERVAVKDPAATARQLERLRQLGVQIALDDFGTGYSSLNYIHCFPVDRLKIDPSFIRHIVDDGGDADLMRAVLAMARGLRVTVLAEGVETDQQACVLQAADCHELQGFYASPPLAAEDFVPWLRRWQSRQPVLEPAAASA